MILAFSKDSPAEVRGNGVAEVIWAVSMTSACSRCMDGLLSEGLFFLSP